MNTLSVFEKLNLRSEWEEIVQSYKFVPKDGTINNLRNFINNGHRGNRFRPGFDRALEVAKKIVETY